MEGDLRNGQLASALRSIGRAGRTGILTVQGREEIIAFSFSSGGIVGADALNQSLEHGLGEVLASQGLVDRSEFAALLAEHEAGGGRVVDLLVERSYLSRGQLLEALRLNTYRLCLEAISWDTGEYRFYQGDEVAYEAGIQPIGVGELLVRSALELGDAGPLAQPVPEPGDVFVVRGGSAERADADAEMSEFEQRVLDALDGERTLAEAAAKARIDVFDLREMASEWQRQSVIEKVGSRGSEADALPGPSLPPLDLPAAQATNQLPEPPPEPPSRNEPPSSSLEDETIEADSAWISVPEEPRRARFDWEALRAAAGWLNRAFGLTLVTIAVALLAVGPTRLAFPFPWQGSLRDDLRAVQSTSLKARITRGADLFFLLAGRYPEDLGELRELGTVFQTGGAASAEGEWDLTATPSSYVLTVRNAAAPAIESTSWTSSVAGNFLLDPDFVHPSASVDGPLLVLLD